VAQQRGARVVLLNLSGVQALDGGGLGMLIFLQMWTHDRGIRLKVFDPATGVRRSLERTRSAAAAVEIAAMGEVLSLLGWGLEELWARSRRPAWHPKKHHSCFETATTDFFDGRLDRRVKIVVGVTPWLHRCQVVSVTASWPQAVPI
jgi:ABC-type transporter Mla MlaB component